MQCSVPKCGRAKVARGYCGPHYMRVRTHGDPLAHIPIKNRNRLPTIAQSTPGHCVICDERDAPLIAAKGDICHGCERLVKAPIAHLERALARARAAEDDLL